MAFDTITINRARVTDKGVELRTSKNGNQYASLTGHIWTWEEVEEETRHLADQAKDTHHA